MAEVGWMALSLNRSVWRLPGRQTNVFFQAVFKVHQFGFFFPTEETGWTPNDRGGKYCHRRPDEIKQTIPPTLP